MVEIVIYVIHIIHFDFFSWKMSHQKIFLVTINITYRCKQTTNKNNIIKSFLHLIQTNIIK